VLVGRSLFMAGAGPRLTTVSFDLPPGWTAHAPWPAAGGHEPGPGASTPRFEVDPTAAAIDRRRLRDIARGR